MRKSTAAAAVALAVSIPSFAFADGMPASRGTAPTPPFTWSGFYVGVNLGYGWNEDNHDNFVLRETTERFTTAPDMRPEGGFGGGQFGYNWQTGPWVWGIETDIQGADINQDRFNRCIDVACPGGGGIRANVRQEIDFFGTVRGRLGYAWDHALLYATAGFAYGGVNDRLVVFNPATGFAAVFRRDETETGWTAGGGVEFAIDTRWSVKLEYQHIDLGSDRPNITVLPTPVTSFTGKFEDAADTIRIGLNYRFGSGGYGNYGPFR